MDGRLPAVGPVWDDTADCLPRGPRVVVSRASTHAAFAAIAFLCRLVLWCILCLTLLSVCYVIQVFIVRV